MGDDDLELEVEILPTRYRHTGTAGCVVRQYAGCESVRCWAMKGMAYNRGGARTGEGGGLSFGAGWCCELGEDAIERRCNGRPETRTLLFLQSCLSRSSRGC